MDTGGATGTGIQGARRSVHQVKGSCAAQGENAAIVKELTENGYQLTHLLKAMCLSRSTYYYEISKEDAVAKMNEKMADMIREIFEHNIGCLRKD